MRSPEDQEAFLNEGRFKPASANRQRTSLRVLTISACTYWAFVAIAFSVNFYIAFFLTLPWSYFAVSLRMHLGPKGALVEFMNTREGGFLVFPLLCGGLNSILLISAGRLLSKEQ